MNKFEADGLKVEFQVLCIVGLIALAKNHEGHPTLKKLADYALS